MKKIIIVGIIALLLISGCENKVVNIDCSECNVTNGTLRCPSNIDKEWFNECLSVNNSIIIKNITARFTVDCSLPEIFENETVQIVYGETIYNNTNIIELTFPEFCKRLESK